MTAKTLAGIVQVRLKRLAKHFLPPDRQILEKEADLIAQVIEESGVKIGNISEQLRTVLDCVDYKAGNCSVNQQVGAVLPAVVIDHARAILDDPR